MVVQSLSHVWLFETPWSACSTPGFSVLHHLPEFAQTHVHWVSEAIQPSHPLLSPSPPAFTISQHQGLSSESALSIRWPKCWSFNINLSNDYSGLISLRIDWFGLLAVQGTLKSLLQYHSLKASVLCHLAFFMVQLWHLYMTTGKTIALTIQTFLAKWYLLFHMLSRFVIVFLPRRKCLNFLAAVAVHSQFSSVAQLCLTLSNPMDCSSPGFPVHHQFLEPTQTHVHHVGDAIQPSYPLSSPSPPAFSLFQHQGLFK